MELALLTVTSLKALLPSRVASPPKRRRGVRASANSGRCICNRARGRPAGDGGKEAGGGGTETSGPAGGPGNSPGGSSCAGSACDGDGAIDTAAVGYSIQATVDCDCGNEARKNCECTVIVGNGVVGQQACGGIVRRGGNIIGADGFAGCTAGVEGDLAGSQIIGDEAGRVVVRGGSLVLTILMSSTAVTDATALLTVTLTEPVEEL